MVVFCIIYVGKIKLSEFLEGEDYIGDEAQVFDGGLLRTFPVFLGSKMTQISNFDCCS